MARRRSITATNAAAGWQVRRVGIATMSLDDLRGELTQRASPSKVASLKELVEAVREHRRRGRRIALTNGCFDLLHVGHVTYLQAARRRGDVLIVAINSDRSVRAIKGPQRPVIAQHDRAAMLAALACVDYVLVFDEPTPHALLAALQPDVLVKGGDYALDQVVGREVVESYGGEVCVTGHLPGVSTTRILERLIRSASPDEQPGQDRLVPPLPYSR
jgi:D-beta-D-heptose 7-phosphate kinase/D-beta-D-heptose 1-phosphate adenosyltransferase